MPDGCAIVTGVRARDRRCDGERAGRRRLAAWSSTTAPTPRAAEASRRASTATAAARWPFGADVTDPEQVAGAVRRAPRRSSAPCSCWSTTPACAPTASPRSSATRQWQSVLETNLSAAFHTTRRALRPMLRARFGRIVNVASVVGPRANAGQSNYAASKAGLIGLTKTVAVEVARRGVTVNAVAPGLVETKLTDGVGDGELPTRSPRGARHRRRGRRLRALPRLGRGRLRDRNDPDRRRRPERLTQQQPSNTTRRRTMPAQVNHRSRRADDLRRPGRARRRAARSPATPTFEASTSTRSTSSSWPRSSRTSSASSSTATRSRTSRPSATSSTWWWRAHRMTRRVVITGVGAVTPLGVGATTLDRALDRRRVRDRATASGRCDDFDPTDVPVPQGGPPRRPLHPAGARGRRRGGRRRGLATDGLPYEPTGSAA